MTTSKKIKVFFDSSVIIAGLASNKGASHMMLALVEMEIIEPFVCEQVVTEVVTNVEKKLPSCLPQFYALFKRLPFALGDAKKDKLKNALQLINKKNAYILAAAMSAGIDVLVSLDKHFLNSNIRGELGFFICTPGEFIKEMFRVHKI